MIDILTAGEKLGIPLVVIALMIFVVVQLLAFITKQQERIADIANRSAASNSELSKAITALADATNSNCDQMERLDKRTEVIGNVVGRIDERTRRIETKLDVARTQN